MASRYASSSDAVPRGARDFLRHVAGYWPVFIPVVFILLISLPMLTDPGLPWFAYPLVACAFLGILTWQILSGWVRGDDEDEEGEPVRTRRSHAGRDTDPASAAKEDAWRRFRSWWPAGVALCGMLSLGMTVFWVLADFAWPLLLFVVGAYVFTFGVVRGVWSARRDVTHLTRLLDGLRGEIVAARALDPEDEVPEGLGLLILDNGLAVYVEGSGVRFLRFFGLDGTPFPPTMKQAVDWMRGEEAEEGGLIREIRPPGVAVPPDLSRIAVAWSLPDVVISFRVFREPRRSAREREAALDGLTARSISSTAFEVPDRRIGPVRIRRELDAIRDALDAIGPPQAA